MPRLARTTILLGASGLVGGQCLELLLAADSYARVLTLGRKLLPVKHEKLEQHEIDFERLRDFKHLFKAQDVFCCLGTTIKKAGSEAAFRKVDFTYPAEAARLCVEGGSQQFLLVSSLGANARSRIFYNRVKGEVEAAIARLPFRGVQIFRPSLLLGERAEVRRGERIAQQASKLFAPLFVGPLAKYRPIEARAVARAMLEVARDCPAGVNLFESDRIHSLARRSREDER